MAPGGAGNTLEQAPEQGWPLRGKNLGQDQKQAYSTEPRGRSEPWQTPEAQSLRSQPQGPGQDGPQPFLWAALVHPGPAAMTYAPASHLPVPPSYPLTGREGLGRAGSQDHPPGSKEGRAIDKSAHSQPAQPQGPASLPRGLCCRHALWLRSGDGPWEKPPLRACRTTAIPDRRRQELGGNSTQLSQPVPPLSQSRGPPPRITSSPQLAHTSPRGHRNTGPDARPASHAPSWGPGPGPCARVASSCC